VVTKTVGATHLRVVTVAALALGAVAIPSAVSARTSAAPSNTHHTAGALRGAVVDPDLHGEAKNEWPFTRLVGLP
jgi:hypothetical protein